MTHQGAVILTDVTGELVEDATAVQGRHLWASTREIRLEWSKAIGITRSGSAES